MNEPGFYKQLNCGETLMTLFNCPLKSRFQDIWSQHNYIVYVIEGRKVWHSAHGSYDLRKGSCIFVRKGASMVEQFFDTAFCLVLFFIPDEFICEVLKSKSTPIYRHEKKYEAIIEIEGNPALHSFFQSMVPYFDASPDRSLLELKFRELVLTLADNPGNKELLAYFCSLMNEPAAVSLQKVMDANYCFNLSLEQYARISNRSLSAFKRDFQKHYNTTPGKWLLEKRLHHAMNLLANAGRNVNEAAFESGFENASHFSRAFKQRFGSSPASFRQPVS